MSAIPQETVRRQLEKILSSRGFMRSERMRRFLRCTVEMTLAGQADEIKEYRIGTEVFDRNRDYDPRLDPIVRVEARRLRRKLGEYYETEGRDDRLLIEFETGRYAPSFRVRGASAPAAPPPQRALAVLPFANHSPEPGAEYLSDGITEELIHALTRIEGLRVAAWHSAAQLRGRQQDLPAVAGQLGVAAVLTGSVALSGGRLRVRAQLIDAASSVYLWSETYDREVSDIFRIQEEIARAIVRTLRVELSARYAEEPIARTGSRVDAYELYLKGRFHWNQRTEEGLRRSVQFFMGALALDERFALAHAGLADAYGLFADYGVERAIDAMPKARSSALRALALDPDLAEACTALALVRSHFDWEWDQAGALYRRALELNPGYATAHHWIGVDYYAMLGRLDEAEQAMARAVELDPLSSIIRDSQAMVAMLRGDIEESIRLHREQIARDPEFHKTWSGLGRSYIQAGCIDRAIEALERAQSLAGDVPNILAALGQAHALEGRKDETRAMLARLDGLAATRSVPCCCYALLHLALGERSRALDWLERGCELRETQMVALKVHPNYDPLRGELRFQAILQKMKLA